jgi:hypothetical protein
MGPDYLGELDKPKKHAWVEEQIEEGTFGPDNAGIETAAAGGMHSVFVDEKGTVRDSKIQSGSYIDDPLFTRSGRVGSMTMPHWDELRRVSRTRTVL